MAAFDAGSGESWIGTGGETPPVVVEPMPFGAAVALDVARATSR